MTSVLFILFLFLSCCHFSEAIAIWAGIVGLGQCRLGTNRFRIVGSQAPARPESIPNRFRIVGSQAPARPESIPISVAKWTQK